MPSLVHVFRILTPRSAFVGIPFAVKKNATSGPEVALKPSKGPPFLPITILVGKKERNIFSSGCRMIVLGSFGTKNNTLSKTRKHTGAQAHTHTHVLGRALSGKRNSSVSSKARAEARRKAVCESTYQALIVPNRLVSNPFWCQSPSVVCWRRLPNIFF